MHHSKRQQIPLVIALNGLFDEYARLAADLGAVAVQCSGVHSSPNVIVRLLRHAGRVKLSNLAPVKPRQANIWRPALDRQQTSLEDKTTVQFSLVFITYRTL